MSNTKVVDGRSRTPFRAWDAFDRLFDEAFSRNKQRPLSPDVQYPLPSRYPEPHPYAQAGATPYAPGSPPFRYSNESLGFSGPEDQNTDDPFDKIWNEGLRSTRRSTVTKSKTKRPKRVLEGSGSNSPATSNDTSSTGPSATPRTPPPPPPLEPVKSSKVKRRKSKVDFQDSADGKTVTATFEVPGISKSDVHVSFQNDKIVLSWESVTIEETTEGDRLVRERKEKKYVRTLPLPEGTKFEDVKASMDGRRLMLTYPRFTARNPKWA